MKKIADEANQVVDLLNILREEEGHYVTVLCPNPDPSEHLPRHAVLAFGQWTGWDERRFAGDSLLEALGAAVEAMREPVSPPEPNGQPSPLPDPASRMLGLMVSLAGYGVSDGDILASLLGSAATCLGMIIEGDPGFLARMCKGAPGETSQVLEGLAAIHRHSVEKMAAADATP